MDTYANRPLRLCNKCDKTRKPEGGIEMSATRWFCSSCYIKYLFRR